MSTTDTVTQEWMDMFGETTDLHHRLVELDKAVPMNNKRSQYGGYGPTALEEVQVKTDKVRYGMGYMYMMEIRITNKKDNMIQANELRIGNLVMDNFDRGNPRNVTMITLDDFVAISNGCNDYHPIPLTEEWLVKCGFVDVNNGYRATGSEVVYEKKDSQGLKVELWEGSNGWTIPYYPNVFTSVHQLQNLYFALTGEEIKIEV